jgi:hypothetical protein
VKAISIRQPWAWLIVHGHKDVENRKWATAYRGPILIHAGRTPDPDLERLRDRWLREGIPVPDAAALEYGGVVGQATVVDCVTAHPSRWFWGPYGFVLTEARPLPFFPIAGRLGIFEIEWPPPAS